MWRTYTASLSVDAVSIGQWASLVAQTSGKESTRNAGDLGSIPGSGRSPGGGNGNPSSVLAWRIPGTEEPGGLQSMGSQGVGQDWATNTFTHWTLQEIGLWSLPSRYVAEYGLTHNFSYFPKTSSPMLVRTIAIAFCLTLCVSQPSLPRNMGKEHLALVPMTSLVPRIPKPSWVSQKVVIAPVTGKSVPMTAFCLSFYQGSEGVTGSLLASPLALFSLHP